MATWRSIPTVAAVDRWEVGHCRNSSAGTAVVDSLVVVAVAQGHFRLHWEGMVQWACCSLMWAACSSSAVAPSVPRWASLAVELVQKGTGWVGRHPSWASGSLELGCLGSREQLLRSEELEGSGRATGLASAASEARLLRKEGEAGSYSEPAV